MDTTPWYTRHDNIVTLAHYLAEHGYDADDVAYAVEKPWKYELQFRAAEKELAES